MHRSTFLTCKHVNNALHYYIKFYSLKMMSERFSLCGTTENVGNFCILQGSLHDLLNLPVTLQFST